MNSVKKMLYMSNDLEYYLPPQSDYVVNQWTAGWIKLEIRKAVEWKIHID